MTAEDTPKVPDTAPEADAPTKPAQGKSVQDMFTGALKGKSVQGQRPWYITGRVRWGGDSKVFYAVARVKHPVTALQELRGEVQVDVDLDFFEIAPPDAKEETRIFDN